MIKLIGILIVAAGFALRLNPLLVVVAAGVATGLVAGLSLTEVLALLGTYFVENRFMTLPVLLMLPVVGLLERHGLQERVATLIRRSATATAGRVMFAYHALRAAASTVAVNIGTHASMVRPMIAPMAEGAAARREAPGEKGTAEIRAHAAAAENLGNFFADDILVAVGPVLLIKGVLDAAGVRADLLAIAWWGAPTALWVMFVGAWRYRALDRRLEGRGR
ncbi:MAG: DUF969 domain-containing protein [Opitutaceae bacterium]|nr:DUF969 domain-containing protein [Opitutaceae bacterium]